MLTSFIPSFLTPPQQQVMDMNLLDSGFNCVLQMHTGSGKTWLAERAIERTIHEGMRAIYVCPTRALSAERYEQWQIHRPDCRVGIFTGEFGTTPLPYPVSFSDAQLLIMTPERLDSCTRHWRAHWHWIPDVDLIIVDEFHLIGDGVRGARLEGALMRLRRLNPFLRIVGLSATLGNREELADWLDGVEYCSHWRPVPLSWKTVTYKRAEHKPELLLQEVHRVTQHGGKSLVFAQSRRRAEMLACHLTAQGVRATHHHAGLEYAARRQVENQFRGTNVDVIVATSTLEVGLNMPVRQVVLYDVQQFDGSNFIPLPRTKVWQRVGRAGRFGLDPEGEAVLLVPAWGSKCIDYSKATFEPCQSALSEPRALAEQIVAELSSGLSRTRTELRFAMSESLAAKQNRLADVDVLVNEMCASGLLAETHRAEVEEKEIRLKPTALGRVAARHMLCPKTVLLFRKTFSSGVNLTFFDLLLIACCSDDCDALIPASFEELDGLSNLLSAEISNLPFVDAADLCVLLEVAPRRLLCALKMALAVRMWTRSSTLEPIAESMNCYAPEIHRICTSLERLLPAMAAISGIMQRPADTAPTELVTPSTELTKRLHFLHSMVEGGLDENQVSLTLVPGIGRTWAKKLAAAGVTDIEALAQANYVELEALGGISKKRAKEWVDAAAHCMTSDDMYLLRGVGGRILQSKADWPKTIDPYRLRRALSLNVALLKEGRYSVTGGLDPHLVHVNSRHTWCDCTDFGKGYRCKHVLAVQKHVGKEDVATASALLGRAGTGSTLNLLQLWMAQ